MHPVEIKSCYLIVVTTDAVGLRTWCSCWAWLYRIKNQLHQHLCEDKYCRDVCPFLIGTVVEEQCLYPVWLIRSVRIQSYGAIEIICNLISLLDSFMCVTFDYSCFHLLICIATDRQKILIYLWNNTVKVQISSFNSSFLLSEFEEGITILNFFQKKLSKYALIYFARLYKPWVCAKNQQT